VWVIGMHAGMRGFDGFRGGVPGVGREVKGAGDMNLAHIWWGRIRPFGPAKKKKSCTAITV
jgi:hypothetical protein